MTCFDKNINYSHHKIVQHSLPFVKPGSLVMIYNMKLLDSGETELEVGFLRSFGFF